MRAMLATIILIFAVLASGVHASPASHDYEAKAVHSHDVADSDHHSNDIVNDSDGSEPNDQTGDMVSHYHMSVGLDASVPSVPNAIGPNGQANLHSLDKVLASLSSRPPIQPPAA